MTPRQKQTLDFIAAFTAGHGYAPTLQEIGDGLGFTKVTAHEHVKALVRQGRLTEEPYKARSLKVVTPSNVAALAKLDRCIDLSGERVASMLREVRAALIG